MRYTPVELRHVKIGRSTFGGYRKLETEKLIEDIADSFEEVWRDRGELTDKLEDVEKRWSSDKAVGKKAELTIVDGKITEVTVKGRK